MGKHALVLVRVEACEREGLLGPVVYIDLVQYDERHSPDVTNITMGLGAWLYRLTAGAVMACALHGRTTLVDASSTLLSSIAQCLGT